MQQIYRGNIRVTESPASRADLARRFILLFSFFFFFFFAPRAGTNPRPRSPINFGASVCFIRPPPPPPPSHPLPPFNPEHSILPSLRFRREAFAVLSPAIFVKHRPPPPPPPPLPPLDRSARDLFSPGSSRMPHAPASRARRVILRSRYWRTRFFLDYRCALFKIDRLHVMRKFILRRRTCTPPLSLLA